MKSEKNMRFIIVLILAIIPLSGCPGGGTDSGDDATSDDDDATGDDDDSAGDDDDATGDDDDATGDDDDSAGDDDDSTGPCGEANLTTSLEVRFGGVAGTTFGPFDSLVFASVVSNPCPFEVTVTANSSCLATSWTVLGGATFGVACAAVLSNFDIPAVDSIEQTFEVGALSVGSYTTETTFDVPSLSNASTTFVVQ